MTIIANPVRESDVTRLRLADVKRVKPGKLLLFMFFLLLSSWVLSTALV